MKHTNIWRPINTEFYVYHCSAHFFVNLIKKTKLSVYDEIYTAQKMNFSIKDLFSKCDQVRRFLRIRSHLLKKSLMRNFFFCAVLVFIPTRTCWIWWWCSLFCFRPEILFLRKLVPKIKIVCAKAEFKLKFGTWSNLSILDLMMFIFSVSDWKLPVCGNLVETSKSSV